MGYNLATFNMSYAQGAGIAEIALSIKYTMLGFHYGRSRYDFCTHNGSFSMSNKAWDKEA